MNYLDLIFEENKGGFVAIKVNSNDAKKIYNTFHQLGLTKLIQPNNMHVTIFFDQREIIFPEYEPIKKTYRAKVKGISVFPFQRTKKVIVLDLESKEIMDRFNELYEMGFRSTYPSFKPHVSIKYNASDEDVEQVLKHSAEIINSISDIKLHNEFSDKLRIPK